MDNITTLLFDFVGVLYIKKESSFFGDYGLNEKLLKFLAGLKGKYKLVILTSSMLIDHTDFIKQLKEVFNEVISARKHGLEKYDPKTYTTIAKEHLHVPLKNIFFIDNNNNNIEAAKQTGIHTLLYRDTDQVITAIKELKKED